MRFLLFSILALPTGAACAAQNPSKEASVFYPPALVAKAKANAAKYPWAAAIRQQVTDAARPWMRMSDDALWDMMFGNTISRSWMVWSDGYCPACKKSVPMYTWQMDALGHPWKVRCPHCKEYFPKNDFAKFHRSGLDAHGVFDPKRADRSLLFNTEHPDPNDPLHMFGVDDGEGYVAEGHRWRFIGAYLIYGQWKEAIYGGILRLAAAYTVTGDPAYAHRAGVLLDRVADLYPSFDFGQQGIVYERKGDAGYVSTWHDACEETRAIALAYDQVFAALREDRELAAFLARKAKEHGLSNPKTTWEDVRRNIEDGILRDALKNVGRIHSNYPRTEVAVATIKAVLGWPGNREEVFAVLDPMVEKATAVDGMTGEKGLTGYTSFDIEGLALLLAQFARLEPDFLKEMLARHPNLRQTYRFHIDTWCFQKYYPQVGDTGSFAAPVEQYAGVSFSKNPDLSPSMFGFLWQLYELTGDPSYVQALYHANGDTVEGLPHDLFADDPAAFQRAAQAVIAREGAAPKVGSINLQQWHLALLRGGRGADSRALWLAYDAGGPHGHANGMNLGLFAKGLDLMPDFGYPPVQFGGWEAPRARWYTMTAAHNTVVVDGKQQNSAAGTTTLWADGKQFRALRVSGAALYGIKQYERTVAMCDLSDRDFYVLDIFRVVGGSDHAKFMHSHFGAVTTEGLSLQPAEDYGFAAQMRNFRVDPAPQPGWSAGWQVVDRYKLLPPGSEVRLRYTDLTTGAQAGVCEGWIAIGGYNENEEVWIPRVMTRRRASAGPLASTFVSVIEPYEKAPGIARLRRLPLETPDGTAFPNSNVAVEAQLADGRRDLFVTADVENPNGLKPSQASGDPLVQKEWNLRLDGEMCWARRDAGGVVKRLALCRGRSVTVGGVALTLKPGTAFVEIAFEKGKASIVSGRPEDVAELRVRGRSVRLR
jgi:hypothetical protein